MNNNASLLQTLPESKIILLFIETIIMCSSTMCCPTLHRDFWPSNRRIDYWICPEDACDTVKWLLLLAGKSLACMVCRSEFTTRRDIIVHVRSHYSDKAFKCRFCDYQTNRNFNMKVHVRTHTDERPFSCTNCKQSFRRKYSLNHHISRHHPGSQLF